MHSFLKECLTKPFLQKLEAVRLAKAADLMIEEEVLVEWTDIVKVAHDELYTIKAIDIMLVETPLLVALPELQAAVEPT